MAGTRFEVGDLVSHKNLLYQVFVCDQKKYLCAKTKDFKILSEINLDPGEFDIFHEDELTLVEPSREESDCPVSDEQFELELVWLAKIRDCNLYSQAAIKEEQKNRNLELKTLRDEASREPR